VFNDEFLQFIPVSLFEAEGKCKGAGVANVDEWVPERYQWGVGQYPDLGVPFECQS